MSDRTASMKAAAAAETPFSAAELDDAIASLVGVGLSVESVDAMRLLLQESAHLTHKDWARTERAAQALAAIIPSSLFSRALVGGNWASAEAATSQRAGKPWVVLVTGVNGIRKTSTVYEPWFPQVLRQALGEDLDLPVGGNSFFRQLDFVMATVANSEFSRLYAIPNLEPYALRKDAIFARYRTFAEIVGARLLLDAKERKMNILVETSGRDVAMFEYVEHFFPGQEYNKLVLNFEVNDISFAQTSVDERMRREMSDGLKALSQGSADAVIRANAGGPYGPSALPGVEADSKRVFAAVENDAKWDHWRKARVLVTARADDPWTVSARGAGSDVFSFGARRQAA